jgi:hypothetical protein
MRMINALNLLRVETEFSDARSAGFEFDDES